MFAVRIQTICPSEISVSVSIRNHSSFFFFNISRLSKNFANFQVQRGKFKRVFTHWHITGQIVYLPTLYIIITVLIQSDKHKYLFSLKIFRKHYKYNSSAIPSYLPTFCICRVFTPVRTLSISISSRHHLLGILPMGTTRSAVCLLMGNST